MRFVWLTWGIAGSIDACLRALHQLGNDLLVVRPATIPDTSYEHSSFCEYATDVVWREAPKRADLIRRVSDFDPHVVLMGSWTKPASYRAVLKAQRPPVQRVLYMDSQWLGTPRQWLARALHRVYLDPLFDCVMVPGDRAEGFARRLGFKAEQVIRGFYTADTTIFDAAPRAGAELVANRSFLFVGRLVPEKGVDVLAAAYRQYRERADDPWDLHVVGTGPQRVMVEHFPGVTMHGFIQPRELATAMEGSSCLVLPSRFDPHPLVVHEAALSSLPLLVTDVSGSHPTLVQDGYNGWVIASESVESLRDAMLRISTAGPERLEQMSQISKALSARFSTPGWARNVHEEFLRRTGAATSRQSPSMR